MAEPKMEQENEKPELEQDPLDEMMPAGTLDEFRQEMLGSVDIRACEICR